MISLIVKTRDQFGKANKSLRDQGFIPAEFYGRGVPNEHLMVDAKDFKKVFREAGENTVINLMIDGQAKSALIHDIQKNYLDESIDHIDFYQVRMSEKLEARIPIEFTGEAPALKEKSGILNKTLSEVEVESLPGDLPHKFTVDISELADLNQSIYVRDLIVPRGVKIMLDPETVIVTVTPPLKEEAIEPPVDVSEVKVETDEKKAERDKEGAEIGDKEKNGENPQT